MTHQEFTALFKNQIYRLKADQQLTFAISICKKLFSDYQSFAKVHDGGNPDVLLEAISCCEQARTLIPSREKIAQQLSAVDAITPQMDDFGDEVNSYALNACMAVYYTLQFLSDNDPSNIFHVGTALTDTIDFKVQENEELTEEQIDNHPFMKETREFLIEQTRSAG